MARNKRWSGQHSPLARAAVVTIWEAGATTRDDAAWLPARVLGTCAQVCRDAGITGSPMTPIRVSAAVNVYVEAFLPWGWTLDTAASSWDERALTWRLNHEVVLDFLWAEEWDEALPDSRLFAEAGERVRLCDLNRPWTSREYANGTHVPLVPNQVSA